MVGNHVADIVARYGDAGAVPAALTDYIEGRQGYDYNEHGRAGNTHADFVPDEVVDRFCLLGPVERARRAAARARRRSASTSSPSTSSTTPRRRRSQAYGDHVIPAVAEQVIAKALTAGVAFEPPA